MQSSCVLSQKELLFWTLFGVDNDITVPLQYQMLV